MDPIQVLGKTQPRTIVIENNSEKSGQFQVDLARVKNTIAGEVIEEALSGVNAPKRYVRGLSKTAKKHFINRKDSPVKNHFAGLPNWSREDAVNAFESWLWQQHQKDAIEKPAKDWFNARVKDLMAGHNIDLIDDIDHVAKIDDSHGYTLKKYIEYLAEEI